MTNNWEDESKSLEERIKASISEALRSRGYITRRESNSLFRAGIHTAEHLQTWINEPDTDAYYVRNISARTREYIKLAFERYKQGLPPLQEDREHVEFPKLTKMALTQDEVKLIEEYRKRKSPG